jgi:serine/threonine protein kinase/DNA-directed RNA polymerase subunit RPC12/RpoP
MSMINFLCSHCGAPLRVPAEKAGRRRKCPRCGHRVEAPSDSSSAGSTATGGSDARSGSDPGPREGRDTFESATAAREELDFLAPAQEPGELGRLGNYRVLDELGSGGMGIVFKAEDMKLKRPVALKVMKKSQAANPVNRERFLREASAAAAVEHDHIVPIYQIDEERGVVYLAMKLLVGESLEQRLNRTGTQSPEEVIRIGMEIAEGLAAAHEVGLIHRDIKPANIWLEEGRDRVKLLDFGLAAKLTSEDAKLTHENLLVGTPMYMSPEQASGDIPLDERSDLFSLGSVMYRMATGKLPFKGRTTLNVLTALATKKPRPPRELNPALSRALSGLILQLLQKRPDDRPKSARAVLAALTEIKEAPPEEEEPFEVAAGEDDDVEVVECEPEPEPEEPIERFRTYRGGRRRGPRREKLDDEEILARKVIKFAIFAGACVFLLLAWLVLSKYIF